MHLWQISNYVLLLGESSRESFFYLNLGGLLFLGHQTTEALLDSGSKVTQKPASTVHLS